MQKRQNLFVMPAKSKPLAELSDLPPDQREEREWSHTGENKKSLTAKIRKEITSLEELLEFFEVDQEVWEVERWLCNQWQMGAKNNRGEVDIHPLYQVKAFFKRRVALVNAKEDLKAFAKSMAATLKAAPRLPAPKRARVRKRKEFLFVPSIMDPHFGKLCWGRETGWEDYDVKIASKLVLEAAADLWRKSQHYDFKEILFPVGNDFFHVDNAENTTTRGTKQDVDGRWFKAYRAGRKVICEVIAALSEMAPVKVVIVPGNHDATRIWTLGDSLEFGFRNEKWISVDTEPRDRKYYAFGTTLLGLEHGIMKKPRLFQTMQLEAREQWATAKHCEWLCGHWHTKKEIVFKPVDEDAGVRVRHIPSLTPPDFWHASAGYVGSVRAAEALIYHERLGYEGQFSYSPE